MGEKKFKILSIDGGGIRGIFPAMFLLEIESKLKAEGRTNWQIYQNFDLLCGTSTGGIIAIALSLGIPAAEIYDLYYSNANKIFGQKKGFWGRLFESSHESTALEKIIREKFKEVNNNTDPLLEDCKKPTFVTIYDLQEGCPSILKSKYHEKFIRDYNIPAYQAALATSSAPTYFNPYSGSYMQKDGIERKFQNKIDGGVFCNNPALTAIVEAQKAFNVDLKNLSILSLGTGHQKFSDTGIESRSAWNRFLGIPEKRENWGLHYWMLKGGKRRLIDLFMQGQSQQVENIISLLQKGIDKSESPNFVYNRITTELDSTCKIDLDEIDSFKLDKLAEKATREFQINGLKLITEYFG